MVIWQIGGAMKEKKKKIHELDKFRIFKPTYIYYTDEGKTKGHPIDPLDHVTNEDELDKILTILEKL